MATNVSVQYNGGPLSDIILLTHCYSHRGTRLNAMRFCLCSQIVRREPGRDGKILCDHRQDGNDEVRRL